jgi:hypothetical protein
MKSVMGGLVDPDDDVECMLKTKGDECGDGMQCVPIRNRIPTAGFHLSCLSMAPDIPPSL